MRLDDHAARHVLLLLVCAGSLGCARPAHVRAEDRSQPPPSVAVYALSRGTGVPAATRDALRSMRTLLEELEGQRLVTRIQQARIGLEGETRLCAEFADAGAARAALARMRQIAQGVELLNIVEEPCDTR